MRKVSPLRGRSLTTTALVIVMIALWFGPAAAQEVVPPPMAPDLASTEVLAGDQFDGEGFGIADLDICTIGFNDFVTAMSSETYTAATGAVGERWALNGNGWLIAGVDCVPNGAQIKQVGFYGRDDSTSQNLTGNLVVYYRESNLGLTKGGLTISSCNTTGSPGDIACFINLTHTVVRRGLWDAGTDPDVAHYQLWAQTPPADLGKTAIAMARIMWRRQISPAPATATFNDVPTGHLFFQHVEALFDSGITAGCGGGNYCPNDPVTRGQMAVFLAKALGLHWPSGLSF